MAGIDLRPLSQQILESAKCNPSNANLLMNLSIAMQCVGQRDAGLMIQDLALKQKRIYRLAASRQPAKLRLLVLAAQGDIATNTPLDCLLEDSDVDLIFYYVSPDNPLALPVPEHDAMFVAICEADEHRTILALLEKALAGWPKPVINRPQYIGPTGRSAASQLLQDVPGLFIPVTLRAQREALRAVAAGDIQLAKEFAGCDFPMIVRPVGSHAGRNLEKIERPEELDTYLAKVPAAEFFLSRCIDYSGKDGLFRKFRLALIEGNPYACHMGISSHWMVHYVNAGMYNDANKRSEEAAFMESFADFSHRHRPALDAIYRRTRLDYLCIDCAETQDGDLFIFEIDHCMVVHSMDPEHLFPYKQAHMQKVYAAFRDLLFRLTNK
jgi:hypothetical protein